MLRLPTPTLMPLNSISLPGAEPALLALQEELRAVRTGGGVVGARPPPPAHRQRRRRQRRRQGKKRGEFPSANESIVLIRPRARTKP